MQKNKFDDMSGFLTGLAGIANDARHAVHQKIDEIKNIRDLQDEVTSLKARVEMLEAKLKTYEDNADKEKA